MQQNFEQQKTSNWVIYREKNCNKTGILAINLYRKLNTFAKDLNFSRICSRLVDVWVDMIPYCLKSSWKWFFRHLLQTFFIVFLCHFLPVLHTVINYPNTWFSRSYLAQSAHKSNKIYSKIKDIWFPFPIYSVLQLPKQCLRKNVVLLNFCLCVYVYATRYPIILSTYY